MTQSVSLDFDADQAIVTLSNAPSNLIDQMLCEKLETFARTLSHAPPPRGVVLTGSDGAFCAGLDPGVFETDDSEPIKALYVALNRMLSALYDMGCPVVAALDGDAHGAGLVLALCADFRIASANAQFSLDEAARGMPFSAVAAEIVRTELAPHARRQIGLGGETINAETAKAWHVIDAIAETDPLRAACEKAAYLSQQPGFSPVKRQLRAEAIAKTANMAEQEIDPATAALGILLLD